MQNLYTWLIFMFTLLYRFFYIRFCNILTLCFQFTIISDLNFSFLGARICYLVKQILKWLFTLYKLNVLNRIWHSRVSLLHSHYLSNTSIFSNSRLSIDIHFFSIGKFYCWFKHSFSVSLFYVCFVLVFHFFGHQLVQLKLLFNLN